MAKFNNKYRIESARLENWDYSQAAAYFITICTANREHFFGTVQNNAMVYSDIGSIVAQEWVKTPQIRPDMNLELDEFMVMPNHFHGVLFIRNQQSYDTISQYIIDNPKKWSKDECHK
jgi:REP element-mobilizing transposase RayT